MTGGTGVLGIYIVRRLLENGYVNIEVFTRSGKKAESEFANDERLTFTNGDVVELFPLSDSIEAADYVIHAAAIVSFNPRDFEMMKRVNVDGTANVMNLASTSGVKKVIHVSSIAALGRSERNNMITEKSFWVNSKYNSYYAITKYLAEQEVWRSFVEGQPVAIVNPSLVFAKGNWDQSSLQIFQKVYDGLPFYPKGGTGIVDAKDVADFIVRLLESSEVGERFILSAENLSYKEIFTKMAKVMDRKPPSKPAPRWMLTLLWRLEKVRCFITGKNPLITRESVVSTAHQSNYDNTKSLGFEDFEYKGADETIAEYSRAYSDFRSNGYIT